MELLTEWAYWFEEAHPIWCWLLLRFGIAVSFVMALVCLIAMVIFFAAALKVVTENGWSAVACIGLAVISVFLTIVFLSIGFALFDVTL